MDKKGKFGVIVGRFQVDDLMSHPGYMALLTEVQSRHDNVLVVLGEAPVVSKKNPLNFALRKEMFAERFPKFVVTKLNDQPYNTDWVRQLDAIVADNAGGGAVLYGNRDSFLNCYRELTGRFLSEYLTVEVDEQHCATAIRERIKENPFDPSYSMNGNAAFRRGVIYSRLHQFDTMFGTVDMLITRRKGTEVLLGQKDFDISKGIYRILGGFIEPGQHSAEFAAAKELGEESHLVIAPNALVPVCTLEITEDWRYRSTTDSVLTHLYTAELNDQTPRPGDDIKNVKWFPIEEAGAKMALCHQELWARFVSYNKRQQALYRDQEQRDIDRAVNQVL